MKPAHILLILLINLAWGFNIVPLKLALEYISPVTAAFVRFAIVAVLLAPKLRWMPGKMGLIFGYALIGGALNFTLNNASIALAQNVSALAIAGQLGVPFSLVLAIIFLGERIHYKRIIGIILAFGGVVFLTFDPSMLQEREALLLTAIGSFCYAIGTIMLRQLRGVPPLTLLAWMSVFCLLPTLVFSRWMEPGGLEHLAHTNLHAFGYILVSAVSASIVGHAGMAYLLARYPITVISPLTLLAPLLAVVFSVWLLDNPLTPQLVIGGLITLAGVGIITFRSAQKSIAQ
jgi:O-acetylserine/cysteine efflux transporter